MLGWLEGSFFLSGFAGWLSNLTIVDFVLIFLPLIIFDLARSVGKCLILIVNASYRKMKPIQVAPNFYPKISLIIPAHNEEAIIVRSIESALETDYPKKEIIIVDDGSSDQTNQLASPYAKRGLIKLVRRDVGSGSKAGALNYGLFFASGEIVVTVDADTLIERGALKEIVKFLSIPKFSAVSGNVRILKGEKGANNLLVKLQAYEYLISLELGRRFNSLMGSLLIISGAFGAFWKKDMQNLGAYDKDTLTEDFDVTLKIRKMGKRLAFSEKAISWTFAPETWKAWRRQRIRWTKGQAETLWKHRNLFAKKGFDLNYVIAIYDMVFMDVIVLFLRFAWLGSLIFFYQASLLYILIVSFALYLLMEFLSIATAALLSPRKDDIKRVYLVPVMVFFYRPYYAVIRFKAYIEWLLKTKSQW